MRIVTGACLLWLFAALSACQRSPEPMAGAAFSPPETKAPVGPIPGGGVATPVRNPYAGDAQAIAQGRRLFVTFNCSGCHGGRAGGGMGPSLRDVEWRYGADDAQIFDSIAQGRSMGMPAWGTRLPEAQIWQLVAYIRSLRTAREPDPPG